MFNELKTKDDAWMQSIHERIDRLSAMIDGIFGEWRGSAKRRRVPVRQ